MKTCGGSGGTCILHVFLTSAIDGDDWLASCSDNFKPRQIVTGRELDRKLGRPLSRSEHGDQEKKMPVPAGNRTLVVQTLA
jgi:hypothetical protein